MQITSKFTIAVHILAAIDYFKETEKVTSTFLAGSTGANPVIIRTVMSQLKEAGLISTSQGRSGITLTKSLDEITFFDLYQAVDPLGQEGLFHFHENPNILCPVGRNIHKAMDNKLQEVQRAMEAQLKAIKVADVAGEIRKELAAEGEQK